MIAVNKPISTSGQYELNIDSKRVDSLFYQFGLEKVGTQSLTGSVAISIRYLGAKSFAPLRDANGQAVIVDLASLGAPQVFVARGLIDAAMFDVSGFSTGSVNIFLAGS